MGPIAAGEEREIDSAGALTSSFLRSVVNCLYQHIGVEMQAFLGGMY